MPGTIAGSQRLASPEGYELSAVIYRSRSAANEPVLVSGLVAIPTGEPPRGGFPIVSFGHGTIGFTDGAAPSRSGLIGAPVALDQLFDELAVKQRYAVAVSDYEGLGLAGAPRYVVGRSAGHSLLDAARAVRAVAGGRGSTRVAIVGHSQGAHATLWAAALGAAYAPELDLRGAVASAPAGDLTAGVRRRSFSPEAALNLLRVIGAWHAVYGLDLERLLTPAGVEAVERLMADEPVASGEPPFLRRPELGPLLRLARLNSPAPPPPGLPVLMLVGDADRQIPPNVNRDFTRRAERAGSNLRSRLVAGADHDRVLTDSTGEILGFLRERLGEGAPARDR